MQTVTNMRTSEPGNSFPVHGEHKKSRRIWYWMTTGLLAFLLLSGGWWLLNNSRLPFAENLGLPTYVWQILGVCKLLGGIAILLPRFPLVKEWAYAGIVFNMLGASASRAFVSDTTAHIVAPLVILGIAIASWYLRPESRKVEALR